MADDYWCPDCDVSHEGPGTCSCGKEFVDISDFSLEVLDQPKVASDDVDPLLADDQNPSRDELAEVI